ncbi:MAG: tetratricopeptide repeat protein [Lentisphaeria bacterium]|nr:tetratricopeptide repeat protein [Lentisphaeria bacterium]
MKPWAGPLLVAVLALAVRLAALPLVARPEYVFAKYPVLALAMLRGEGQARTAFTASPLYLYFWMAMHRLLGSWMGAAIPVQMALGALMCAGVAIAASGWCGRRAALGCGICAALYLPFVVNDASFVSEGLVLLCNTAALACLAKLQRGPRLAWALGAGVALGLSGMARPNILLYVPFAMAAAWLGCAGSLRRRRLALAAAVLLPALAGPLLLTVRNAVVSGQPVLVMSDSGIVLYLGNNELDTGLSYFWPRHEPLFEALPGEVDPTHRIAHEIAEKETGERLGPADAARFWRHEALRFPRQYPLEYAGLLLRKVRYVWHAVEAHDVQTTFTQEQELRRWPLLRFGWVAPLALIGLAMHLRSWRRQVPLYGLLFTYTATGVLFTVVARYRLPMLPAVLILAWMGIAAFRGLVRGGRWGRVAAWGVAAVACFLLVNLGDYHTRSLVRGYTASVDTVNRAEAALRAGDHARARELYLRTVAEAPTFALVTQARYSLGLLALREGNIEEAVRWRQEAAGPRLPDPELAHVPGRAELERHLRTNSDDVETWYGLGARLWAEEEYAEAEKSFAEVTRRVPVFAPAHLNRAWCLFRMGRLGESRRWAEAARRLQPELEGVHGLLLRLAAAEDRLPQLEREYERLVRIDPGVTPYADALEDVRRALSATIPVPSIP